MKSSSISISALFFLGIVVSLLQIWLPDYYLTCDGPCHLANAHIVNNFWQLQNQDVFGRFYNLVYTTDPNSMTTFVLAALMFVFKGIVAEKVFLSLYVLVFTSGFFLLLRKLQGKDSLWQLSVFVFIFTYAFAKGFYNFSFGIAFFFWMVLRWIIFLDKRNIGNAVLFVVLAGLTFFTHLLPFVFGGITCGALVISYAFADEVKAGWKKRSLWMVRNGGALLLCTAPYLLLSMLFTSKEGGMQLKLSPHLYRLVELVEFKYIINVVDGERFWTGVTGVLLFGLLAFVIVRALPKFRVNKYDGLFLSMFIIVLVYTFFPEEFLGRLIIISIRAQLFVLILVACCLAYRLPEGHLKSKSALVLFFCFLVLSVYRYDCRRKTDVAMHAYMAAFDAVKDGDVLLPLDFSPTGKTTDGRLIAKRNAVFHHAAQYLTAQRPVVVLDNYEAGMGYFPVRWKDATNPYKHLSRGAGIEGLPPYAEIVKYEKRTGVAVDNILLWCYEDHYLTDKNFAKLYAEIKKGYYKKYTSKDNRVILYSRNKD